jgi:hypothetical protein
MKIDKKENYSLFQPENESATQFISDLTRQHSKYEQQNIVVNMQDAGELENKDLLGFLEISNLHREAGRSFVIVRQGVEIDELPEELVVVPSLQEAEDMIQMDDIQRDLGF